MSIRRLYRAFRRACRYLAAVLSSKQSYGQHQDDLAVETLIGPVRSFLDIGANDGLNGSNTVRFALKGARGLAIEANPSAYERLSDFYRLNRRVVTLPLAVSDREGNVSLSDEDLLSSIPATRDESHLKLLEPYLDSQASHFSVGCKSLTTVLQEHPLFKAVDFVSLDVEGHEWSVLQGIDFQQFKTRLFNIETHGHARGIRWVHQDYQAMDTLLKQQGYFPVLRNPLNTFWVHREFMDPSKIQKCLELFEGYEPAENPPFQEVDS